MANAYRHAMCTFDNSDKKLKIQLIFFKYLTFSGDMA